MQYFVVMIDYGHRGREAIVDPEITRREVISRIASGEYRNIASSMKSQIARSRTSPPILSEAALPDIAPMGVNLQASHFDHIRDLRKQRAGVILLGHAIPSKHCDCWVGFNRRQLA
jgi:hypothetical protein